MQTVLKKLGIGRRQIVVTVMAWMFVVMAVICAVFVLRAAVTAADHVPYGLDTNEGWNAYHAQAAVTGRALYPSLPSFMYNNYPPLSFYLVGFVGEALGNFIEAGRILSIIGFLLTGWGIAWAARRMGCTRLQAGWGVCLFMTILLMDYDYVGMNDPQLLGHAFTMAGLCLILREPRTSRGLIGSALLFSTAFFIKQSLIVLPLAVVLWLFLYDRRSAIRLALLGAVFFLAGSGAFQVEYGKSLWSQINAPRSYDLSASLDGLAGWLELGAIPVTASMLLPLYFARDRHVVFCLVYLALSLTAGTFFYGGGGVGGNVFFDALIALALCATLGVNRLAARGWQKRTLVFASCHFIPLMAGLVYLVAMDSIYPRYWLEPRAPERLQAARDIVFVRAQQGPVMCALLSLCYWAGKPAEMDIDLIGQAMLTGRRDPNEVLRLFAGEKFVAIQLLNRPLPAFEDDSAVGKMIAAHYHLDHVDTFGRFFLRNGNGQSD